MTEQQSSPYSSTEVPQSRTCAAEAPAAGQDRPPSKPTQLSFLSLRERIQEWLLLNLGILLLSIGIYIFKFPNNFTMGGVSGMSVIFAAYIPSLSPSLVNAVLNFLLLILGFAFFGRHFGLRTTYATVISSLELMLLEHIWPLEHAISHQPLLELFFAVLLPAAGSAILFNHKSSSGGTDILAMILRKYSSIDIGKALLVTDLLFVGLTFVVFDVDTGLFSLAGLLMKGVMVDGMLEGFNRVKAFTIVTSQAELVGEYICKNLHRSATIYQAEGLFSHQQRTVFLCVVNRYQAVRLRSFVREVDPQAFITISNTSEIVGKGFRSAP